MSHLDHVLPWIGLRQGKDPKRKPKWIAGHRTPNHRRFTQQHVREMREMRAAGFRYPEIAAFWGSTKNYVRMVTTEGLRDDEREPLCEHNWMEGIRANELVLVCATCNLVLSTCKQSHSSQPIR